MLISEFYLTMGPVVFLYIGFHIGLVGIRYFH